MSGKKEMKKRPLTKEEFSVLVTSICFSVVVLVVLSIIVCKVGRIILRMM